MVYRFEWDEDKAKSNRIGHGVSFDEATTVFDDSLLAYAEGAESL